MALKVVLLDSPEKGALSKVFKSADVPWPTKTYSTVFNVRDTDRSPSKNLNEVIADISDQQQESLREANPEVWIGEPRFFR